MHVILINKVVRRETLRVKPRVHFREFLSRESYAHLRAALRIFTIALRELTIRQNPPKPCPFLEIIASGPTHWCSLVRNTSVNSDIAIAEVQKMGALVVAYNIFRKKKSQHKEKCCNLNDYIIMIMLYNYIL